MIPECRGKWINPIEVLWSEVAQSCPTLCPPGSSIHGIFQARVLEWVATSFSRGSSWPRDWTQVSRIAGRRFTIWATREAPEVLWTRTREPLVAHPCSPKQNSYKLDLLDQYLIWYVRVNYLTLKDADKDDRGWRTCSLLDKQLKEQRECGLEEKICAGVMRAILHDTEGISWVFPSVLTPHCCSSSHLALIAGR